jgi:hypothetical protein
MDNFAQVSLSVGQNRKQGPANYDRRANSYIAMCQVQLSYVTAKYVSNAVYTTTRILPSSGIQRRVVRM